MTHQDHIQLAAAFLAMIIEDFLPLLEYIRAEVLGSSDSWPPAYMAVIRTLRDALRTRHPDSTEDSTVDFLSGSTDSGMANMDLISRLRLVLGARPPGSPTVSTIRLDVLHITDRFYSSYLTLSSHA